MRTVLHGALPEGWRDPHGVFRTEPGGTILAPDDPSAACDRLAAAKATVDQRLTALLEKVRSGETDPRVHADLATAAETSASLSRELKAAQREAEEQQNTLQAQQSRDRRQRLETALTQAAEQKKIFAAMFRATCLALGEYCAAIDTATTLANSLATQLGVAPLDKNRIAEVQKDLTPSPRCWTPA